MARPVILAARSPRVRAGWAVLLGVTLVTAGLLGLPATVCSAATADSESNRVARRYFQSAEAHFHAGRFGEALTDYQAGYDAEPLPGFLVNIAQCQRRLGELKKARATYQTFLLVAPDSPLGPDVKALIAEIDQALLEQNDAQSLGATAEINSPIELRPSARGAPPPGAAEAQVSAAVLVAMPEPSGDRSTEPKMHPASHTRWLLWGTLAAVVVGGALAVVALWSPDAVILHDGSLGTLRR